MADPTLKFTIDRLSVRELQERAERLGISVASLLRHIVNAALKEHGTDERERNP
jgi:hypothetical protein